jgi:signal peptidase
MAARGRRSASPSPRRVGAATGERSLLSYIGAGLSAGLLVVLAGLAVVVIGLPAAVGGMPLTVLTNSMAPGLPPGTLVVMKPTPIDEIRVGDVLTYQIRSGDPAVVSHRVIAKATDTRGETTFTTKGDNNDVEDSPAVMEVQVKGTVWYSIPLLGWVNNAITGESRSWLIPVAAGLLFAYAGYTVVVAVIARNRRRRGASAASSGDN